MLLSVYSFQFMFYFNTFKNGLSTFLFVSFTVLQRFGLANNGGVSKVEVVLMVVGLKWLVMAE